MPDDPKNKASQDIRNITTPIGAVLGVLAVRGLIPEEKRSALAYMAGAGVGGSAGYVAGSYMNPYGSQMVSAAKSAIRPGPARPVDALRDKMIALQRQMKGTAPGAEVSDKESETLQSIFGQEEYDAGRFSATDDSPEQMGLHKEHVKGRPRNISTSDYIPRLQKTRSMLAQRGAASRGDTDAAAQEQSAQKSREAVTPSLFNRTLGRGGRHLGGWGKDAIRYMMPGD